MPDTQRAPADDITLPALPEGTFCSDLPGHIGYPASGLRAYARAAVKLDRQRGDEKRHFICLCPDCTKPADRASTSRASPVAWMYTHKTTGHKMFSEVRQPGLDGAWFREECLVLGAAASPATAAVDVGAAQAAQQGENHG